MLAQDLVGRVERLRVATPDDAAIVYYDMSFRDGPAHVKALLHEENRQARCFEPPGSRPIRATKRSASGAPRAGWGWRILSQKRADHSRLKQLTKPGAARLSLERWHRWATAILVYRRR